jgi:hypothetical protein
MSLKFFSRAVIVLFIACLPAAAQDWAPYTNVTRAGFAVSPEVRSLPLAPGRVGELNETPLLHRPSFVPSASVAGPDVALQTTAGSALSTVPGAGFDGVLFNGYYPPDGNISVSDTQIVQTTNVQFAVYDKAGTRLSGPSELRSLFGGLSNTLCGTTNGGDPIVLWDKIAHRWLISQLAFNNNFSSNYVCIAISTTSSATGSFNTYAFSFTRLPDYPKFGVWSSSSGTGSDYYFSANLFSTALYYGPVVCAFNGSDMQSGTTPRFACKQNGTSDFSLLPSDYDGGTPPAQGEKNYFLELGTGISSTTGTTLKMYPFVATWTSTGGSLNSPTAAIITVPSYAMACSNGGACIPQPGTTKTLDSLGDRLMYRLAYRDAGTYKSLLVNHSVNAGSGRVGIRWYELRSTNAGATWTKYQASTFAPGSDHRWMGSMAQDKNNNIGIGYSISSSSIYPSINYTGRRPGDPVEELSATESTMIGGSGAETGGSRWGDYTSLSIDPVDDCTFWYTNEYFLPNSSGGVGWRTRIGSFKFPDCTSGAVTGTTTSTPISSGNPSTYGADVTFTVTVGPTSGGGTPTGTVQFLDNGNPLGSAAPLSGGSASLTTKALSAGPHSITASYSGDSNFSGSTSDGLSQNVNQAGTTTSVASSQNPSVSGQSVTFTATVVSLTSGTPTGTVQFYIDGAAQGSPATLTGGSAAISTSALSAGAHQVTASYGGDSNFIGGDSAALNQTVNDAPAGTFSLSATPGSRIVSQNGSTTYTITVSSANGFAGTVTLSATGVPPQSIATFSPNPVTLSGNGTASSVMSVTVGKNTPRKTYTITITGTSGSLNSTTTVTVTVQ